MPPSYHCTFSLACLQVLEAIYPTELTSWCYGISAKGFLTELWCKELPSGDVQIDVEPEETEDGAEPRAMPRSSITL